MDKPVITVDDLAQEIRRVDGNHSLGAGALAEAIMPFIEAALSPVNETERLREALERIAQKADNGTSHGLLADGYCEEIADLARAALGRKP